MDKPDVDFIEGLSPAISIDQKSASRNPRSTVGTITEVYDYLRLLFARIGVPHCPTCGRVVNRQTPQQIVDRILELPDGTRFQVLAPVVRGRKGEYEGLLEELSKQGFSRARVDGEVHELTDVPKLARYEQHTIEVVVDRLVRRDGIERRLTDSLETALRLAEGVAEVQIVPKDGEPGPEDETMTFSQHLACTHCGLSFDELAPRNFSFNSPYGACPTCSGLGTKYEVDPELVVPNPDLSIDEGAISPWANTSSEWFQRVLAAVADAYGFKTTTPFKKLNKTQQKVLLHGAGTKKIEVSFKNRYGRVRSYSTQYEGAIPHLTRRHADTDSDYVREQMEGYMREVPCNACGGARLKPESLAVTIDGNNINELCELSIGKSAGVLAGLELSERDRMIAERVVKEINARMQFLLDVGLDYLTLNRSAGTLAGGEAQRIRLASQIGSGLVGVLYVLDEPSIGLHQRDNRKLIDTMIRLRDLGNTRHRRRARRGHDQDRRPHRRHRSRGRRARRLGAGVRVVQRPDQEQEVDHRSVPQRQEVDSGALDPARHRRALAGRARRPRAQPQGHRRRVPPRLLRRRHRRVRLGQVDPRQRHPLQVADAEGVQVEDGPGPAQVG